MARSPSPNGRILVDLEPDGDVKIGDLIESDDGTVCRVVQVLDERRVIARPRRWYDVPAALLYVFMRPKPLPFPHAVVDNGIIVTLGSGHGAEVGDSIDIRKRYRFRIVQLLDRGRVLVRRRHWYDGIASVVRHALGAARPRGRR